MRRRGERKTKDINNNKKKTQKEGRKEAKTALVKSKKLKKE